MGSCRGARQSRGNSSSASACAGNMDEAVITGASTLRQAIAVAGIPGAGDITAGVDSTQIAEGEARIIDAATAGPVV